MQGRGTGGGINKSLMALTTEENGNLKDKVAVMKYKC